MLSIAQLLAIVAAGLFAGAAIYVNLVEHPARLESGTEIAAKVFGPSYRRAAAMQATLALVGTLAGLGAWLGSGRSAWLAGAILLFAVVPFTLSVILPINKKLLDPALDPSAAETRRLLVGWGRLHAVRSFLGAASFFLFLWAA